MSNYPSAVSNQEPHYYWIHYTAPIGHSVETCTTRHPFQFIHSKNLDPITNDWPKMKLLNWKQITKEEFEIWITLNPISMDKDESEIYSTKEMD